MYPRASISSTVQFSSFTVPTNTFGKLIGIIVFIAQVWKDDVRFPPNIQHGIRYMYASFQYAKILRSRGSVDNISSQYILDAM